MGCPVSAWGSSSSWRWDSRSFDTFTSQAGTRLYEAAGHHSRGRKCSLKSRGLPELAGGLQAYTEAGMSGFQTLGHRGPAGSLRKAEKGVRAHRLDLVQD